jgi:hypothetical protein
MKLCLHLPHPATRSEVALWGFLAAEGLGWLLGLAAGAELFGQGFGQAEIVWVVVA